MLTVRIQAIDGARTLTPQDSQPCRLLPPVYASRPASRPAVQNSGPNGSLLLTREDFFILCFLPIYSGAQPPFLSITFPVIEDKLLCFHQHSRLFLRSFFKR